MNTATTHPQDDQRSALSKLWNNQETRSVILQILTMAILIGFFFFIVDNAIANLAKVGKTFSFDFLNQPASYDINQTLISYTSQDTHFRAGLVGLLNTALVAGCGIVLATIVGFILGVFRLSPNWLINRVAYCYIEFVRNVPVLLHILLIHGIVVHSLPSPRALKDPEIASTFTIADSFFLTNRGFQVPSPEMQPLFWAVIITFFAGIIFTFFFRRWARGVQEQTGKIYPVFWISLAAIVVAPLLVFFVTGMPLLWDIPKMGRFNLAGGLQIKPEFLALWLALSMYTAAFIAEIVRAGILAVNWGQWEAAFALGLRRGRTLNLIIIPQALRVIVPPLTSQYLNLTKNSSLALAIGYMDIVATIGGISLMQTGKEMETMFIVIGIYLAFSLSISSVMNWYNQRIKLVER